MKLIYLKKTNILFHELTNKDNSEIAMIEFRCSEIFTLKSNLALFISIRYEFANSDISSLLTYWDNLFHEIKSIISNDDRNTSWLSSKFEHYKEQHELVDDMFRVIKSN